MKTFDLRLRHLALALATALVASLAAGCGDNKDCQGDQCVEGSDEICVGGADEDGDGAADCADADCQADPACGPQCGNMVQNVGEGCDDGNRVDTDDCTNTCNRARCGDGIVHTGVEQCDDANSSNTDGCTTACENARCGDGFIQAGEECDDANTVNTDGCTNTCRNAACGDGFVQMGEQCDDGNMVNTDACTNACTTARCGDGITGPGEQCDDANMVNTDACTNACRTAACGDGFVGPGEACDDGNMINTDGCTNLCRLPSCGDGFVQAGEQCDDGNMVNTDACLNTCMTATCGDGVTQAGVEQCDDMNQSNTDACLNTCRTATCGDTFVQAGVEQCDDGNMVNTDACTNVCQNARCGDGITGPGEVCDDGNMVNGDGCDNTCSPSGCGNGIIGGAETCDDGNMTAGDGCSATCMTEPGYNCGMAQPSVCNTVCGDGVIAGLETCDQGGGNVANGDGCSMTCLLESGWACGGTPSVCANTCGNGTVNANEVCDDANLVDGDGCSANCQFSIGCVAGETQIVATNGMMLPIPDFMAPATVSSPNLFASTSIVTKTVVYIGSLTHTFDADLDISLVSPRGITRDLSSDNGSSGDDYTRTFLDDGATGSVTTGTAPFTGRFRPEQSLGGSGGYRGQRAMGTWNLAIADDASGDTGTLNNWSLIACVSPTAPRCGDGMIQAGEECDDGNDVANDTCSNACTILVGCGNGIIDAGEQCDDDNLASADGCSSTCQVDIGCAAGQVPVTVRKNQATPIPDNDLVTGVSSTVAVAQAGSVVSTKLLIASLTHTSDADLDIYLVSPNNVQRELSTDNGSTGDNYTNTVIDDAATTLITSGTAPFTGSFKPETTMSTTIGADFRRLKAAGNWTLRVFDDSSTDATGGTLNDWTLFLCVDPAANFCGDGVLNGTEECDDGNTVDNDTCSNLCQLVDGCGDGNLDAGEVCDDNNILSGDGCTTMCQLEITCPIGQTAVNLANTTAAAIPDNDQVTGVSSVITVAPTGAVTAVKAYLRTITHTADGDLDMFLIAPNGVQRELSTDNGGLSDNFVQTLFDDAATTAITSGTAPYTGAFKPEQSLATTAGVDFRRLKSSGNWTLRVFDDAAGDTGTLAAWSLLACVDTTATYCGDSIINGGEECDDGNTNNTDACNNLCQLVDGCGDGNIDAGEICDDNNVVSGDGCSSTCMPDISCGAGEMPVVVTNNTAAAIPDNNGGVLSAINAPTAGLVRKAIATINITHAVDAHLDIYLMSPRGGQRALATDKTGVNYVSTIFADAAPIAIGSGVAPFTGLFRPDASLDGFNNQAAQGDWLLRIGDDTTGTTGTLNSWSLALCVDTSAARVCGNGFVEGTETCDDGNTNSNDGCSNQCQLELGCAVGQTAIITTSADAKAIIQDNTAAGITSTIAVAGAGNVQKAVVVLNSVGHQFDGDLNFTLTAPNAATVDVSSGNGSSGDDFISTMFTDSATTSIVGVLSASAPFRGQFKPEAVLSTVNGQAAAGNWSLKAADVASIDAGIFRSWTIGLCVQ